MSSDCHHMKIIKGKGLIVSLFLSFVTLLLGWLLFVIICQLGYILGYVCSGLGMLSPKNILEI
jgi:hypothetical protein